MKVIVSIYASTFVVKNSEEKEKLFPLTYLLFGIYMYMCMYACIIHTCMHAYMYVCLYIYIYIG